jgi:AcrR family transcriptional regulator
MPRARLDTDAVVTAAAALADADGLNAVTLARLASRLGVRAPSLYAHITSLADLRRRIATRGARQLTAALQTAAAGRAGGDALTAVAEAYRTYAREHAGTYTAIQHDTDLDDPEAATAAYQLVDVVLAILRGYGLEQDDAVHAARIVRAALHGFVSLEADRGFELPLDLDGTYARLVAVLDQGLAGASQPKSPMPRKPQRTSSHRTLS